MPMNGSPSILRTESVFSDENAPPRSRKRLSRSPQPYHRRGPSLPNSRYNYAEAEAARKQEPSRIPSGINFQEDDEQNDHTFDDTNGRKRRKYSASPSDSGTEADDESAATLKGLPAPPARLRKGFKDTKGLDTSSPLLTPSYFDDDRSKQVIELQMRNRGNPRTQAEIDAETLRIRHKFIKRRKAELLRRLSEVILLGLVGWITYASGTYPLIRDWHKELLAYTLAVLSLCLLYPFRLLRYYYKRNGNGKPGQPSIKIPSAFDPAPLLYPILVPTFAALALSHVNESIILPNLILSISSIPHQLIPFHENLPGYGSIQWLLSVTPLVVSALSGPRYSHNFQSSKPGFPPNLSSENLVLIFPLHMALLPSLGYLTTTSLLPAELQLLSISLINLLLLATSPQAIILKALLWIGGLSLLILCGYVLRWEVALARVPGWRFRRPSHEGRGFWFAVDEVFNGCLSKSSLIPKGHECSDSDDIETVPSMVTQGANNHGLRVVTLEKEEPKINTSLEEPRSAVDGKMQDVSGSNGHLDSFEKHIIMRRRHTLPSYIRSPSDSHLKHSRFPSINPRTYLSLTRAQAAVLKWLYAIYTYLVVIAVIVTAIRTYVSQWALNNLEPVGWALGYLFGDLPLFRQFTFYWDLQDWICLPSENYYVESLVHPSLAEKWRQEDIGSANTRILICIYCLGTIGLGLATVFRLSAFVEVDTRRKVFHGMMVVMFLPAIFVDPNFAALALILILAIFLLLDVFRASQLPPLSRPLTTFLAPYVDGRDHRGPVIVSHMFLLIGCAIPLWLSLATVERTGKAPWEGWDVKKQDLSMVSGVICVGMGDAAASLFGRRYGRHRWCWSGGKSIEGSLAFAIAVIIGLGLGRLWLQIGGWAGDSGDPWVLSLGKACIAATGASLTEATLTGGNDNVIVPIILWLYVRGLRM